MNLRFEPRPQAIAVSASILLLVSAAMFRAAFSEVSLSTVLLSTALFLWDCAVTGLVHFCGARLHEARSHRRHFEERLEQVRLARSQVQELGAQQRSVDAQLAEQERAMRRAIVEDFDVEEMQAFAASVARTAYFTNVHKNRGKRFPRVEAM